MRRALFPGTFDPPTNGHLDILRRASALFDEVVVAVAVNPEKNPVLDPRERMRLLAEISKDLPNVRVSSFHGLAIEFARRESCTTLLRGIRTVTDFEYEYAMAVANRKIGRIETLFLVSSEEFAFLSSRLIREAAAFGGDIGPFVPPAVEKAFKKKMPRRETPRRKRKAYS
ncbi:MAG: pantetheine-phosphate adenylyltransferase [Planctomycetes bacterium]|jgi:pantetheine-phosphate adenylyltransferase|nr:pantetheine-phosphate adenylyltransferase [Planctomycetota bacterium]